MTRGRAVPDVPGEELVGAGAHRLEDQVRFGRRRDCEDRHRRAGGAETLDRSHSGRRITADIDDDEVRCRAFDRAPFDDTDRDAAGAQQERDPPLEFFVIADDLCSELRHVYCTSRITRGKMPWGAGPAFRSRMPGIGVIRP
jgi:hypothetical protein